MKKSLLNRTCLRCGKKFHAKPYTIKVGEGIYCSRVCQFAHRAVVRSGKNSPLYKEKIERVCEECGIKFNTCPSQKRRFCSKKCLHLSQKKLTGQLSNRWRGGKVERICKICGDKFFVWECHVRNGHGIVCSSSCRGILAYKSIVRNGTKIELRIEEELKNRNIEYYKQVAIPKARTIPDFILNNKIIIYCDGDYWHNLPNYKIRDAKQNIKLKELGYKVYRFWEHEINKSAKECIDKVFK